MGIHVSGIFGLVILIADIWAIVKTLGSTASTGMKVFWTIPYSSCSGLYYLAVRRTASIQDMNSRK